MDNALFRSFFKYASLNVLGMISLSCYILADTFFVAQKLGSAGLAALNLSIPLYSVIHGLGLMVGIGGATRFSILKFQEQHGLANTTLRTALQVGIMSGLLFVLLGLFGSSNLASALGADMDTLPMTKTYLRTIFSFAPFLITNNVVLAFTRNDGNPKLAMVAMFAGSFSNIILDYVFMFPLNMGMFGAAIATGFAPIISLAVLASHFWKKHKLSLCKAKSAWSMIPDLFGLGLSAFILEVSSAICLITFNLVILRLAGNLGVAAYGIVANLSLVGIALFTGLAQGAQPLISRYYGLQQYDLARRIKKYAFVASAMMATVIYLGTFSYTQGIVGIFNSENSAQIARMAGEGLRVYFLGFFFVGFNIVAATFLSATEKTRDAFLISVMRGVVIIVPLVLILSRVWDMTGVWLSFVLTEFCVTVLTVQVKRQRQRALMFSPEAP